jgi:hypothetical protein
MLIQFNLTSKQGFFRLKKRWNTLYIIPNPYGICTKKKIKGKTKKDTGFLTAIAVHRDTETLIAQ